MRSELEAEAQGTKSNRYPILALAPYARGLVTWQSRGMAYVTDRIIHDADAHVMETPEWIEGFATQRVLDYALDHFDIGDISATLAEIEAYVGEDLSLIHI